MFEKLTSPDAHLSKASYCECAGLRSRLGHCICYLLLYNSTYSVASNNTHLSLHSSSGSVAWTMSNWVQHLKQLARAAVSSEARRRQGLLHAYVVLGSVQCSVLDGGLHFLAGCQLRATLTSSPRGLFNMSAYFLKGKVSLWKMGFTILYDIIKYM